VQSRALETKKPGALARSGLGGASAIALAVLRVRTRRVLAEVTRKVGAAARIESVVRQNITPGVGTRRRSCAIVHCSDDSRRAACFPTCRISRLAFPPPVGSS
jgi:hypothetical protein